MRPLRRSRSGPARQIEVIATGDSGTMLTGALLSAGDPEADVIFGIDDNSASRAVQGELLDPVAAEVVEPVPERYRLDGAGADLLVPIDTGDVCMNVDSEWFAAEGIEPHRDDRAAGGS